MSHVCHAYHSPNLMGTHSGINILGEIPWGSHFCEFYENEQDLLDVLILYFMEGLSNNECCYWVSADEDEHQMVYQGLKNNIPGLDELLAQGKMYLTTRAQVMPNNTPEVAEKFLSDFVENYKKIMKTGFSGVRAAGTPASCTSREAWEQFIAYEASICKIIENHKIIALCCYSLHKHSSMDLVSVVKNHEFSLIRCNNDWEMLEKSSIKITKNQLHKVNRELEQRVNERTENLLTALHARDQFLAVASHELKTPIAALRLYADGLTQSQRPSFGLSDKTKAALIKIQEQSMDLEALLNNLLDVTGFQKDGLLAISRNTFDLASLTRIVVARFNEKYNDLGVRVSLSAPEALLGQWDGLRLKQVLKNLIENALKYSSNQPVTVTLSKKNNCAILSVKDTGIGIAKNHHTEIFERFIQLSNKKFVGGFGLGLWIVKQIVEAHKGLIAVKSALGKGAEFIVTLPLEVPI